MSNSAISVLPQPAAQARRRAQVAWVLVAALLVTLLGGVASPANASTGSISGNVKGVGGANLQAAEVILITTSGVNVDVEYTNAAGNYIFNGLAAGSYKLLFLPPAGGNYVVEWWNNKDSSALADPITVTPGVAVTGRNVVLVVGATISGRITGGSPAVNVADVTVQVFRTGFGVLANGRTDANGFYTITRIPAGSYTLFFIPEATDNYLPEFWEDEPDPRFPDFFPVSEGASITGKDANLTVGSTIRGTLKNNSFGPIAGFALVYSATGTAASGVNFVKSVDVGVDGRYSIVGLRPGSYRVGFTDRAGGLTAGGGLAASNPHVSEWRNDKYSFDTASIIVLSSAGQIASNIDGTLENPQFADVRDPSSPFYRSIEWMWSRGISAGTAQPSGKPLYMPADAVSRQAMALFMFRLSGESFTPPATSTFADVTSASHPQFYTAIEWMAAREISEGTAQPPGKPLFKPSAPVSRQAMAIFLARYAGATLTAPLTTQRFADVPLGATSARAINWMFVNNISTGTPQPVGLPLYKPSDPVSRQAMAVFLDRLDALP